MCWVGNTYPRRSVRVATQPRLRLRPNSKVSKLPQLRGTRRPPRRRTRRATGAGRSVLILFLVIRFLFHFVVSRDSWKRRRRRHRKPRVVVGTRQAMVRA